MTMTTPKSKALVAYPGYDTRLNVLARKRLWLIGNQFEIVRFLPVRGSDEQLEEEGSE